MMVIVRIFPSGELEESWNSVLDNLADLTNLYCTPLYLSQREEENFMTITYDVKDPDWFADIVVNKIPSLLHPEKMRTITFLRPVFFPAPKDRPQSLDRYQVAIKGRPGELEAIFNHLLGLSYPTDAFPTYAAYSFGEDDILLSMLSTGQDKLERFLKANMESQSGVTGISIGHITRSKRVAPTEMWKRYRERRYLSKPTAEQEEYDFLEREVLHGAREREVETSSFW
jgi:hypothetical protein